MVSKKRPRVMYFPTLDYLTPYQQKKKLKELASKVVTYNMYDNITSVPKLSVLRGMTKDEAKNIITIARSKHKNHVLQTWWGLTSYALYNLFEEFDVPNKRKPKPKQKVSEETKAADVPKVPEFFGGFTITLKGSFGSEDLADRLLRTTELLKDDKKYFVEINIQEQ